MRRAVSLAGPIAPDPPRTPIGVDAASWGDWTTVVYGTVRDADAYTIDAATVARVTRLLNEDIERELFGRFGRHRHDR